MNDDEVGRLGPEIRSRENGQPMLGSYASAEAEAAGPVEILRSRYGRHRVEILDGIWRHPAGWNDGRSGRWSRLLDVETGETLFDSARIFDSSWVEGPDGALLFRLRCPSFDLVKLGREELFRIDPATRTFRNLALGDAPRALAELQRAVVDAHTHGIWNDLPGRRALPKLNALGRAYSPFGGYRCEILYWDAGHGWGLIPCLFLTGDNEPILDLGEWGEEAGFAIEDEQAVRITLPGSNKTVLEIRPAERTGRIDGAEPVPLAEIEQRFFRR